MEILDVRFYSAKELVSRLRKVCMLQDREAFPYKTADIQVTSIPAAELAPAQLYVLRSEFDKVRDLRYALQDKGVDILRLYHSRVRDGKLVDGDVDRAEPLGFVEILVKHQAIVQIPDSNKGHVEVTEQWVTVLPPIVEVSEEGDRSVANIINDGMHRCFLARVSRVIPDVVRISGVPKKWPYYAFPLAEGWRDVQVIKTLDEDTLKKFHRTKEYKKLYRDFNSAFTNVGGPRGTGK